MTNTISTKRTLLFSVVALFLCFVMLLGTTFAWFTDSVTSTGNKIVAGNLDVQLLMYNANTGDYEDISTATDPVIGAAIFGTGETANADTAATLWEPGKTQTVYLAIENAGTLDLKYQVALEVKNVEKNLTDVVSYAISPDAKPDTQPVNGWVGNGIQVGMGINPTASQNVGLTAGNTHYFALSVHMDEEAGNEYQEGSIEFDIKVLATQFNSEEDSFGKDYDKNATYPGGAAVITYQEIESETVTAGDTVSFANDDETFKVDNATAGATGKVTATLTPTNSTEAAFNASAANGKSLVSYDVKVTGQQDGSNVTFSFFIGKNLADVEIYHNGVAMDENDYSYSASTGYVTITTDSFSPFEASFYYADDIPLAKVTKEDITKVNATLGMGGAATEYDMDVAYKFATTQTYEEAKLTKYANYHADFVISTNDTVPANSVALIGYYELYCEGYNNNNWVALQSDADIPADTEIRLLNAMFGVEPDENGYLESSINYGELCNLIPEFLCGVSALDAENVPEAGTTITVELRLYETLSEEEAIEKFGVKSTNYETGEYLTVCTYTYTF